MNNQMQNDDTNKDIKTTFHNKPNEQTSGETGRGRSSRGGRDMFMNRGGKGRGRGGGRHQPLERMMYKQQEGDKDVVMEMMNTTVVMLIIPRNGLLIDNNNNLNVVHHRYRGQLVVGMEEYVMQQMTLF